MTPVNFLVAHAPIYSIWYFAVSGIKVSSGVHSRVDEPDGFLVHGIAVVESFT